MAEEVAIDLNIKTGEAEKNTQSLKAKLKSLKQELAGLEEGSEAFNKIAKEAGEVQDKIGDLNQRVKNLASDTRKLDTVVGVAQGIAGGFAAAQGAAALFGAENEDLNKTLLKVQGSVALLNGVQQIANTLNKDSAVMTNLNTAAQTAYTFVVGTSTGALKLFRIALASTGIGLVVIAIGALIENFDSLSKWIKTTIDKFDFLKITIQKLGETYTFVANKVRDFLSQFGLMDSVAEHAAKMAEEREIKRLESQVKNYEKAIALQKALGNDTYDLEMKLWNDKIELAKLKGEEYYQILAEQITAIRKKQKEDYEQWLIDEERRKTEEFARNLQYANIIVAGEQQIQEEKVHVWDNTAMLKKMVDDQMLKDQKTAEELSLFTARVNATAKQNLATQGLSFARNIANIAIKDAHKNAIAMKALAIVELAINTAKSISNAIAGATQSATATGPGAVVATPLFIASQIATVLAAAAQAAAIIAAPIPTVNAPSAAGGSPTVEQFTQGNTAPQVPQTPSSIPIPQQVYVTETDISGVQGQVNVIEGLAKIH